MTTLAGLPIAIQLSGIEFAATLPIDKIAFFPIVVPGVIIHPGVIHAPDFIKTASSFLG